MRAQDEPPEFDPKTWTPDKPWPKGYYKPVPGLIAQIDRQDRASGDGAGFRRWFWLMVTAPLQAVGLAAAAGNHLQHGLFHTVALAITPVPLFLLFALVLPALLYAGIVAPPGMKARHSLGYGLGWSLACLALVLFGIAGGPLVHALFQGAIRLLQP